MTPNLEVKLNKSNGIFVPGESVSGQLIVSLDESITITALTLRFKGKCRVSWQQGKSRHSAQEIYFEQYSEFPPHTDGREFELTTGNYVYPFSFVLPQNIPSTFEHQHGLVRYSLKAMLKRSWRFNQNTKIPIRVEAPLDLISNSHLLGSVNEESIKKFMHIIPCNSGGHMILRVRIPTTGYTAGEWIGATVNLDTSATTVQVSKVGLLLKQKIVFRTRRHCEAKRFVRGIAQKNERAGPFEKQAEFILPLNVPNLPLSYNQYCNLIDINYTVKVIVSFKGCHTDFQRKFDIIIGTKSALLYTPQHDNPVRVQSAPTPVNRERVENVYSPMPMPMPPQWNRFES